VCWGQFLRLQVAGQKKTIHELRGMLMGLFALSRRRISSLLIALPYLSRFGLGHVRVNHSEVVTRQAFVNSVSWDSTPGWLRVPLV
jgi:hypothetical protein